MSKDIKGVASSALITGSWLGNAGSPVSQSFPYPLIAFISVGGFTLCNPSRWFNQPFVRPGSKRFGTTLSPSLNRPGSLKQII
ncbi:MAG: hypothetical protein SFZ03_05340 [Candidatus Melainabacteria bacterium]|nr:hypothetical protein [Candidatus Melainabacteria bacterium]